MPLKGSPRRDRSQDLLALCAWLLASLAAAALSHVLIDCSGTVGAGGDAYEDHAHGSVAPIALCAVALIATLLLRSAALRIGRSQALDPAMIVATRFGTMSLFLPVVTVALGGFLTLLGMEFSEQFSAFGHLEGIADALGGNVPVGLAIIGFASFTLTFAGLRLAAALLNVTVSTVGTLCAWIAVAPRGPIDTTILRRRLNRGQRSAASALLAESRGLRAPPSTV